MGLPQMTLLSLMLLDELPVGPGPVKEWNVVNIQVSHAKITGLILLIALVCQSVTSSSPDSSSNGMLMSSSALSELDTARRSLLRCLPPDCGVDVPGLGAAAFGPGEDPLVLTGIATAADA